MATDPRLTSTALLTLAAMRVQHRQEAAPRQTVTLQVVYHDALGVEPDLIYPGPTYERREGEALWRLIPD
jgi:hypothetical protein